MSRRGVIQCQKIVCNYTEGFGDSAGIRCAHEAPLRLRIVSSPKASFPLLVQLSTQGVCAQPASITPEGKPWSADRGGRPEGDRGPPGGLLRCGSCAIWPPEGEPPCSSTSMCCALLCSAANGRRKLICVKRANAEEVYRHVENLSTSSAETRDRWNRVKEYVDHTHRRSVQGRWTIWTFDKASAAGGKSL